MTKELKSKILAFRLTPSGSEWLHSFAEKLGLSESETIRQGLNALLHQKQQEQDSDDQN